MKDWLNWQMRRKIWLVGLAGVGFIAGWYLDIWLVLTIWMGLIVGRELLLIRQASRAKEETEPESESSWPA